VPANSKLTDVQHTQEHFVQELKIAASVPQREQVHNFNKTSVRLGKRLEYRSPGRESNEKDNLYSFQRQMNFGKMFNRQTAILQADPELLPLDQQVKFKILDTISLRKFKREVAGKYDAPVLESALLKMSQTDFLKQLNMMQVDRLEQKKRIPPKS
jgi:hypothetical protein